LGIPALHRSLLSVLILIVASSRVVAACVDPSTLAHSTVSITRHFDDKELEVTGGLLGVRGTGWFLSPTSIVTVEHVATAMKLSEQDWKQVEVGNEDNKQTTSARIQRFASGSGAERIAVLELRTAFIGARGFQPRMEPFLPDEPVVSLAYPHSQLRVAGGRFVQYGDGERLAGTALLELYDGNDRLVLDHGASGAPVLDCAGRVVAVVSHLVTTTILLMSSKIRTSTAWGSANVVSVPISFLKNLVHVE
jgi:hypothetical protein